MNDQMIIIHQPYPVTSSLNTPAIIVNTDVNAAYRAFPQIYVAPVRGRKSAVICPPRKGRLNLMFPDLRATPNVRAKLSYCRVTRWQSGSMDIVQLLTTGTKFVLWFRVSRYHYGMESSYVSFVHTAYI